MEEPKSIEELLKELNDMQLQFDNLNEELIITKNKKRTIKTDLASDKIDTDFFKTLTAPTRKKTNNKQPKTPSENISEDTLLFSLDTKSENVSSSTKGKVKHIENKNPKVIGKIVKTENTIIKKEKLQSETKPKVVLENKENHSKNITPRKEILVNLKNKESIILNKKEILTKKTLVKKDSQINVKATEKENSSENTYLSIKQKLEKIKKEISSREQELIKEKGKVIPLITTTKPSIESTTIKSTVLKPVKKETKKIDAVKKTENIEKKVEELKKGVAKKISTENNKTTINQPEKKRDTVDILTIVILILLIILITTAWILLK